MPLLFSMSATATLLDVVQATGLWIILPTSIVLSGLSAVLLFEFLKGGKEERNKVKRAK